jgi:hypothetical protein
MNERIKLLAEQSCEQVFGGKFGEMKLTMLFAEKFAELIIRDCWTTISPFIEDDNLAEDALAELKEQFGVEE